MELRVFFTNKTTSISKTNSTPKYFLFNLESRNWIFPTLWKLTHMWPWQQWHKRGTKPEMSSLSSGSLVGLKDGRLGASYTLSLSAHVSPTSTQHPAQLPTSAPWPNPAHIFQILIILLLFILLLIFIFLIMIDQISYPSSTHPPDPNHPPTLYYP